MRLAIILAITLIPAEATTYDYVTFTGPNGIDIYPQAMNNSGQIVGYYLDSAGTSHGFLRSAGGTFTTIDVPGAVTTTIASISNTGWIAGSYVPSCCNVYRGFRLSPDGMTFVSMAVIDGVNTMALGVNSNGEVMGKAGTSGFVTTDGVTFATFVAPNGEDTYPMGMNDRGDVVGYTYIGYQTEPWLRIADGTISVVTLGGGSQFTAINNQHQIVGTYPIPGAGVSAFLRNADGSMTNIAGAKAVGINNNGQAIGAFGPYALYNPDGTYVAVSLPGSTSSAPIAINDSAQILGQYTVTGSDGKTHNYGFLAAPMTATGPAIRSYHGVTGASGYGGLLTTAPGSWMEIYGVNLAGSARSWQFSDFQGNSAPTSLDGVTVSINGQPAYIAYVSPGQVNAVVPAAVAAGTANVSVRYGGSTSAPQAITVNPIQPAMQSINGCLFPVFADGVPAATDCPGENLAQPTRTAHPGDIIVFYGIGFGPVAPAAPDGQIVTQLNQLEAPFGVNWQNLGVTYPGQVTYAGLAPGSLGLYQFNVVVPPVANSSSISAVGIIGAWTVNGVTQGSFPLLVIQ